MGWISFFFEPQTERASPDAGEARDGTSRPINCRRRRPASISSVFPDANRRPHPSCPCPCRRPWGHQGHSRDHHQATDQHPVPGDGRGVVHPAPRRLLWVSRNRSPRSSSRYAPQHGFSIPTTPLSILRTLVMSRDTLPLDGEDPDEPESPVDPKPNRGRPWWRLWW